MADYASQVLADGAVGYWRLNEASGASGADASGNGRAVTYLAPITYGVAGPLSTGTSGVAFPGAQAANTGYAVINGAASLPVGTGPMSFECWILTTVAGPVSHFIADNKTGSSTGAGFNIYVATFGGLTFGLGNGAVYAETSTTGGINIADGRWHHVVIVVERLYDAVHDRQRIYVDGVLNKSTDVPAAGWNLTSVNALFLGRYVNVGNPGGFDYAGSLDEVAWYQTALTPTQVAAHYAMAFVSPVIAPASTGRQYLLGLPSAGVSSGTGPWIALGYRSCRLLVTTIGSGTITAGSVQLEETDDPQDGSGATPMALGAAINCVSVSGNKKACTHLGPGAYGYIRARVSADVVGGGSVYCSLAGMP